MFRTIPNQITLARILSVPLLMYLILSGSNVGRILAVILFFLAAVSDAVDGYLARSFKQTTTFGKFADPIADKLLITGALIALLQLGELPGWAVMVIVAREFLVTGLRILAISEGEVIAASILGKLKTQSFNLGPGGGAAKSWALWVAIALSLISGGEYFYRSRRLFV